MDDNINYVVGNIQPTRLCLTGKEKSICNYVIQFEAFTVYIT
jgi:hypothetical protein